MSLTKGKLTIGVFVAQGAVWILLIVLEVAFGSVAERLPPWAKVSLALGVLTALGLVKAIGYFQGICAVLTLRLRDHDIVPEGRFVKVMGQQLKHGPSEVTLTFYNIPLSTLDRSKARRLLWEEAIRDNPKVDEFRLLIHPTYLPKLLGYLTGGTKEELKKKKALASKMHVGVIEFPREEVLNFACVVVDKHDEKKLRLASATVMTNPFWNGRTFTHFFLFAGGRKTLEVCNNMRTNLAKIWDQAKRGAQQVTLEFPPIAPQYPSEMRDVAVAQFLTNHDLEAKVNKAIQASGS